MSHFCGIKGKRESKDGDLWHDRGASFALLGVWIIQQVWLKRVEFGQLKQGEVTLDLLLIYHSIGQRLLDHLTVIDFLLHGALERKTTGTINQSGSFIKCIQ